MNTLLWKLQVCDIIIPGNRPMAESFELLFCLSQNRPMAESVELLFCLCHPKVVQFSFLKRDYLEDFKLCFRKAIVAYSE